MGEDLDAVLVRYLKDVHALEQQELKLLEAALEMAGDPQLEQVYRGHLLETKEHERYTRERIDAHGASPSNLKDVALETVAASMGLATKAASHTPAKLAAQAFAFQHLEIASYELLIRVAERAGDSKTIEVAQRIIGEERSAAEKIAATFDVAVESSLQ